jgi:hypothetical protein
LLSKSVYPGIKLASLLDRQAKFNTFDALQKSVEQKKHGNHYFQSPGLIFFIIKWKLPLFVITIIAVVAAVIFHALVSYIQI